MRIYLKLGALALCLLAVAPNPAVAQQQPPSPQSAVIISARESNDAGRAALAELAKKAERQGKVRVIVHLDVDLPDADPSSGPQLANEQERMQGAQREVIGRGGIPESDVVLFTTIPYFSAFVTASQLARLMRDPGVLSVQEDIPDQSAASPAPSNDRRPMLADSVQIIGAPEAWRRGITGEGQVVAILSTGVDFGHPALKGKVLAGFCRSSGIPPESESLCPGGVASSNTRRSGQPCAMEGCEPGTGSASIIAGRHRALMGVAPDAKLISGQIALKANHYCEIPDRPCLRSFHTDQISALERIYSLRKSYNIAAVVLSVEGAVKIWPCDTDARAAIIRKLYRANIPTILGAGNGIGTGLITAPGCITQGITAGATTKDDLIWQYSLHSPMVDLLAPGEYIYAAIPGGGYAYYTGTSVAADHVAGAIALLKQFRPEATIYQMLNALRNSGVPIDRSSAEPGGRPTGVTQLRIDVPKALQRLEEMIPHAPQLSVAR